MMPTTKEIMSSDVFIVSPQDSLAHVRNLFLKKKISRALVYDKKPLGMVTERDLAGAFMRERRSIDQIAVAEVMSKGVITAEENETPENIAKLMIKNNIAGVPVCESGEITGIVTKTDLMKYFSENFKNETKVSDIMTRNIKTIEGTHSMFHAIREMQNNKVTRLPVMCDKKVIGIITERDIAFASLGARPTKVVFENIGLSGMPHRNVSFYPLTVGDVMRKDPITTTPDNDAAKAAGEMLKNKIGSLIVMDNDKPAGIVTKTDFVKWLAGRT